MTLPLIDKSEFGGYEIAPLDDFALLLRSFPLKDGEFKIDERAMEKREDFMVKTALRGGPIVFVLLGRGHDLSDNVPAGVRVWRVGFDE